MVRSRTVMVVFAHYPEDRRVRREAEALATSGIPVDVICLRKDGETFFEMVEGVAAYRLPVMRKRGNRLRYLWEYALFFALAFLLLSVLHLRRGYPVVHVHNMPDLLVFCALVPKITGSRVILDLHDPMPELFMTKYRLDRSHRIVRFITLSESLCIQFSHLVLTPNSAFRERFIQRGASPEKVKVIMNTPDLRYFRSNGTAADNQRFGDASGWRLMYHGALFERNGLDVALEAVGLLRDLMPGLTLDVYGDGDYADRMLRRIDLLDLGRMVRYGGFVPPHLMGSKIELADIGVIPNRRTPFTEINLPTRIFEFLCMGKPVIVPRTTGISDYFDDDSIMFFTPDDPADLARVIRRSYEDAAWRRRTLEAGMRICERYAWELQKKDLVQLVGNFIGHPLPGTNAEERRRELMVQRGGK